MNKTIKAMCVIMILLTLGFAGFGVLFMLNDKIGMGFIGIGIGFVSLGITVMLGDGVLFNKNAASVEDAVSENDSHGSVNRVRRVHKTDAAVQHVSSKEDTPAENQSSGMFKKKKKKAEKPVAVFDCNLMDITHGDASVRCNASMYSSSITIAIAGVSEKKTINAVDILEYLQSSSTVKLKCMVDGEETVYALTFNSALSAKAVYQTVESMKGDK